MGSEAGVKGGSFSGVKALPLVFRLRGSIHPWKLKDCSFGVIRVISGAVNSNCGQSAQEGVTGLVA